MEAKQLAMTTEPQPLAEVKDLSGGLLEVIARAARDPNVDIDKMERLLEMQERVHARNARAEYTAALAEMQPDLPIISERGRIEDDKGNTRSTYALWEDINEAIKPILAQHGFALSFKTRTEDGRVVVTGILSHRAGHSEETEMSLPSDNSGKKNAVQSLGSSVSYGKRYTAAALLNLTSRGDDDDGHQAGMAHTITEKQVGDLEALIQEVGANKGRFLAYLRENGCQCGDDLESIPAADYSAVVKALEAKRK